MPTRLQQKDILAGAFFALFGGLAFAVAQNYEAGTAHDMGPGYFPRLLGMLLILLGTSIMIRGLRARAGASVSWAFKPLAILTLAMVLFGFLVERIGLVPAMAVLVFVTAMAGSEFKFKEVTVLAALTCLFSVAVFVWGLKMYFPLFAWRF
jgi:hypothetical protein